MNNQTTVLAAAGRILMAILFLLSGISKLTAPTTMTEDYIASTGLPAPFRGYLIAVIVEVGGGLALVLGYRTRIVALILAAFSVATALAFHNDFFDQNQLIHFLKNVAVVGGLLQVAAFGAGAWSLDARRVRITAYASS
ncbi:DoxX family protein [Bradyrhizobium elkanii]|uniref:DoxX family protein n=1 Tax=Bradyrhizobium elkanii TaxID=29448 RepID=UPI003514C42B